MNYFSTILQNRLGMPSLTAREWQLMLGGSAVCLSAWVAGASGLLLFANLPSMLGLLVALLTALLLSCWQFWTRPLVFMLAASCWSTWAFQQHFETLLPSEFESTSVNVTGQVVGLPNRNEDRIRFSFRINESNAIDGQPSPELAVLNQQLVQLSCYRCPFDIQPNQHWQLTVRMKRPHGYASWGAFDYEKYLFRHKVVGKGYVRVKDSNQLLANGELSVDQYRAHIRDQLTQKIPQFPKAKAMMAALMIGDKSRFSSQQRAVFQATGVSHLMAISGLHVGLVFLVVAFLFKWLLMPFARLFERCPRQTLVLFPAWLAALSYSALAGFAVSTQRAMLMLTVFVICKLLARETSLLRVLLISAAVLLLLDPFSILDIGFWLSCGAVFIIAVATPKDESLSLLRLQPLLWLGMIPLTLLFFGQVSLISPLVNLIMVPLFCTILIPLVLLSLVLWQLGLEKMHNGLLEFLGWSFHWVDLFLTWLYQLPNALYFPASFNSFELSAIAFALLTYFMRWRYRHAFIITAILAIVPSRFSGIEDRELRISLLDVGQGLAMVIEAHDYVLVYDTGPAYPSGFSTAEAVLLPYLRHRGIRKINDLIISHADNDHIGGYPALSGALEVDRALSSRPEKLSNAQHCRAGQKWQRGDIQFEILSPSQNTPEGSNNHSCVLMVSLGEIRALITGDIERQVERHLLNQALDLQANILLVPHQGSKTSSTAEFIDAVNPQLAMVAAGYRNHYGHPHADVVARYQNREIKLLSTVENGSITLKIKNNEWQVDTFRHSSKGFWHRQKKPKM